MRLYELKSQLPYYMNDAAMILRNAGYKQIGYGEAGGNGNSIIFHKDGQKSILKLYPTADTAFTKYVDFCLDYKDCPHFPKFSYKSVKINDEYSAIRTERLVHKNSYNGTKIEDAAMYMQRYLFILSILKKNKNNYSQFEEAAIDWINNYPSLKEAIEYIFEGFPYLSTKNVWLYDMEPKNIMFRGETLVFIDPVWSGC